MCRVSCWSSWSCVMLVMLVVLDVCRGTGSRMYALMRANRLDVEGHFVTGSYDKQLISWHMQCSEPHSVVEGQRVTDLAVSADGSRLVLITAPDQKIKMYSLPDMALLPCSIPQVRARQCAQARVPCCAACAGAPCAPCADACAACSLRQVLCQPCSACCAVLCCAMLWPYALSRCPVAERACGVRHRVSRR